MSDLDAIARVREGLVGITDENTMDGRVEPSDVRALLRIIEATAKDNALLTEERDRMNATLDEVNQRLAKLEPQIETITSNNAIIAEKATKMMDALAKADDLMRDAQGFLGKYLDRLPEDTRALIGRLDKGVIATRQARA